MLDLVEIKDILVNIKLVRFVIPDNLVTGTSEDMETTEIFLGGLVIPDKVKVIAVTLVNSSKVALETKALVTVDLVKVIETLVEITPVRFVTPDRVDTGSGKDTVGRDILVSGLVDALESKYLVMFGLVNVTVETLLVRFVILDSVDMATGEDKVTTDMFVNRLVEALETK